MHHSDRLSELGEDATLVSDTARLRAGRCLAPAARAAAGEDHPPGQGVDHRLQALHDLGRCRAAFGVVGEHVAQQLRQGRGDPAGERLGTLDELREELELLEVAGADFDEAAFRAGELSPAFFASALTNFGVEPFLRQFLELAPSPEPREAGDVLIRPDDPAFRAFVFKIQANMDPKHRDRIAFARVVSGRYQVGMTVKNVRSGKDVRLTEPQQFFGRERSAVETAWPGDVVGIHDRGSLRIGDTLSTDGEAAFQDIPRFSPEHFARVHVPDPLRRKHLDTGLRQLSEEGAAQVFYADSIAGPAPIVGAVGPLQFDVLVHRLDTEYDVEARLERLPYVAARWVTGPEKDVARMAEGYDRQMVQDAAGRPLVLFKSEWAMQKAMEKEPSLTFHSVAP
ncbi:MAG: hypothetical protein KY453_11625 [Gemmatimonadetes bacterium]|nr:hypothetical protein [Gemmatimonadota bacterium]